MLTFLLVVVYVLTPKNLPKYLPIYLQIPPKIPPNTSQTPPQTPPKTGLIGGLSLFKKVSKDLCSKFRPEIWPKTIRKTNYKRQKNLPEGFSEYPEILNKPVSFEGFGKVLAGL